MRVIAPNFSGGVTTQKTMNWPQERKEKWDGGENGWQGLSWTK